MNEIRQNVEQLVMQPKHGRTFEVNVPHGFDNQGLGRVVKTE